MLTRRQTLRALGAGLASAAAAGAGGLTPAGCSKRADVSVGSKNFQEQWILSALLAAAIRRDARRTARTVDLAGSFLCHKALTSGDIDCYVEYTGTAWTAILSRPPLTDADEVYRRVREAYAGELDLLWLPPLGFENTFAILVRRADAERHGLEAISDLRRVTGTFRPGFGFEFYDRADGYRGLCAAYGLEFANRPAQMKLSQTYLALDEGEVDVIAGNSTDGLVGHFGLVMLRDDKRYFPPYAAAPVLRARTAERYPEVRRALEALGGKISAERMTRANYAVDHERRAPAEVAAELLAELPAAG